MTIHIMAYNIPVEVNKNLNTHGRYEAEVECAGNIISSKIELAYDLIRDYPEKNSRWVNKT